MFDLLLIITCGQNISRDRRHAIWSVPKIPVGKMKAEDFSARVETPLRAGLVSWNPIILYSILTSIDAPTAVSIAVCVP